MIGANLTVPIFNVVLRKAYGLGAIAMTGGSFEEALFSVSWPTGEFGGMGLEGSVKLGYRNELPAIADPGPQGPLRRDGRRRLLVGQGPQRRDGIRGRRRDRPGRHPPVAGHGAELSAARAAAEGKKRAWVDTW